MKDIDISMDLYTDREKESPWREYKTVKEKARNIRRNIILEMIMSQPNRNWSYREIADEARKLPWFQKNMPTYSRQTAYNDYLVIRKEMKSRREELAEDILVKDLDEIQDQIDNVRADLDELGSLSDFIMNNDEQDIGSYIKAKNVLLNALDRLMARRAKLVPLELPKTVNVNQTHMNIDVFRQLTQEAQITVSNPHQLEDGLEDGEYS